MPVVADDVEELLAHGEDGQVLALLLDALLLRELGLLLLVNLHVVRKLLVVPVVELVVGVALLLVVLLLDAEEVAQLGAGQLPLLLRGLLALGLLAVDLDEAGALLGHHRHVGGRVPAMRIEKDDEMTKDLQGDTSGWPGVVSSPRIVRDN